MNEKMGNRIYLVETTKRDSVTFLLLYSVAGLEGSQSGDLFSSSNHWERHNLIKFELRNVRADDVDTFTKSDATGIGEDGNTEDFILCSPVVTPI